MRNVRYDARKLRQCRKAIPGRDASRWDDHTCTMASRSFILDGTHGVGAGNGVKEGQSFYASFGLFAKSTVRYQRDAPDEETNDWRAVCGRTARTVRREGRRKPFLPLSAVGHDEATT
jgi:hypothetical protein